MDKHGICVREGEKSPIGGEDYSQGWSSSLLGTASGKVEHKSFLPLLTGGNLLTSSLPMKTSSSQHDLTLLWIQSNLCSLLGALVTIKGTRPRGVSKVCLHSVLAIFVFLASTSGGSLVHSYFRAVHKDLNFVLEQQCLSQSWLKKRNTLSCWQLWASLPRVGNWFRLWAVEGMRIWSTLILASSGRISCESLPVTHTLASALHNWYIYLDHFPARWGCCCLSTLGKVILESKLLSLAPVSCPLLCALSTSHQLSVKLTEMATLLGLLSLCREIKLSTWNVIGAF